MHVGYFRDSQNHSEYCNLTKTTLITYAKSWLIATYKYTL